MAIISKSWALNAMAVTGAVAIVATFAAGSGPSLAQSSAPRYDWSGLYVGAHGGYRWMDANLIAAEKPVLTGLYTPLLNLNDGGQFLGGGHIGYNWQMNALVLGIEGDGTWGKTRARFGRRATENFPALKGEPPLTRVTEETWSASMSREASVRARIGYASGSSLWYLTGGVSWSHAAVTYNELVSDPGQHVVTDASDGKPLRGWTLGGGVEVMLMQNWLARLEYRHTDYGKLTVFGAGVNSIVVPPGISLVTDTARAGLSYKF